jgi:uroporphyrinogen decarboxylase
VSDQLNPRTPGPLSPSDRGMLELMTESGADLVSVDRVDLADALRKVGGKVRVVGNFGTSDIWLGSAAEIETAVEAMVKASRSCPKGYVASTGCEVPVETPPENVDAFIRAAREAGLNPSFGLVSDKTHA